jgi:hypothetical protein
MGKADDGERGSGTFSRRPTGLVCVFARVPEPGRVKMRLAPVLGAQWAAELASAFVVDTWYAVNRVQGLRAVVVLEGGAASGRALPELTPPAEVWAADEGDERMQLETTLRRALTQADWALAIRTDSPGLPPRCVEQASDALMNGVPAVLGPSEHGGFYLLGVSRCDEGLLTRDPVGGALTAQELEQRLHDALMSPVTLEPWYAVEAPADLARLRAELSSGVVKATATARALRRTGSR